MRMSSFQTVIPDSSLVSLFDLCFKCLATHLETICMVDPQTKERRLKQGLKLPKNVCEKLIEFHQLSGESLDDGFLTIFENTETTLLRRVHLRNTSVTDRGLRILLSHNLTELHLENCESITERSLPHINEFGDSLSSLVIGPSVNILTQPNFLCAVGQWVKTPFNKRKCIIQTPNLHRLTVRDLKTRASFFPSMLLPLLYLDHLDLSGCYDLGKLSYLCKLENLSSLVLYNVRNLQEKIGSICLLKKLRHLDISSSSRINGNFPNENQTLAFIVESLPLLTSLDISGINLAGTDVEEDCPASKTQSETGHESTTPRTDIPGLASRVNNPLEFLGLYRTHHRACRRHSIPAKKISGDANESQIMNAAAALIDKPAFLRYVLDDLYILYIHGNEASPNACQALSVFLGVMDRHVCSKRIQTIGSALLFNIVSCKDKDPIPTGLRRKIISTILNGIINIPDDDTIVENCCLVLSWLNDPQDLLFDYERVIYILCHVVLKKRRGDFVQQIGTYILNSIACDVGGHQNRILGELGVIKKMLTLIEDRIEKRKYDDVLENALDTIREATDNIYINCQMFLDGNGLKIFLRCLKTFPKEKELLRSMMGLFGNVAEVESLRSSLMTSQFVTVFSDLLDSISDDIEVTYNLAGVLSHMGSDGLAAWTISNPKREDVLRRMVSAIESWDLSTKHDIDYRSLAPILHLVQVYHTPECQHWAVWALASLTHVQPSKFCTMVEVEGGVALLEEVMTREEPYPRIKELAAKVIDILRKALEQVKKYRSDNVCNEVLVDARKLPLS